MQTPTATLRGVLVRKARVHRRAGLHMPPIRCPPASSHRRPTTSGPSVVGETPNPGLGGHPERRGDYRHFPAPAGRACRTGRGPLGGAAGDGGGHRPARAGP